MGVRRNPCCLQRGSSNTITGASRGIGAAIAAALAYHDVTVVINFLNSREKAEELLNTIEKNGGSGSIAQADVRDRDQVNRMVDTAIKQYERVVYKVERIK